MPRESGNGIPVRESEANLPPRIHLRCPVCEESFSIKRSHFLQYETHHCSRECAAIARSDGKWVTLYCAGCGEQFKRRVSDHKRRRGDKAFHNRDCWQRWINSQKIPDREYMDLRNERRYERYWSDPDYRAAVQESARRSGRKRRATA